MLPIAVAFIFLSNKAWTSDWGQDRDWGRSASQLGKQANSAGSLPCMTKSTGATLKAHLIQYVTNYMYFLKCFHITIIAFLLRKSLCIVCNRQTFGVLCSIRCHRFDWLWKLIKKIMSAGKINLSNNRIGWNMFRSSCAHKLEVVHFWLTASLNSSPRLVFCTWVWFCFDSQGLVHV